MGFKAPRGEQPLQRDTGIQPMSCKQRRRQLGAKRKAEREAREKERETKLKTDQEEPRPDMRFKKTRKGKILWIDNRKSLAFRGAPA